MIVFWGTITVENLLGLEGFLGTPKKEKRKKSGCLQNSEITKKRRVSKKKEKKQQNLIRLQSEFTYHQQMNIEQISCWIQLQ